ncbi:MAG: flippase-like domain-containing protein [Phycisphaeraceae bacterium]|nr:flippase-like domain-containing protein [Phycisphaeraceae bacterium]
MALVKRPLWMRFAGLALGMVLVAAAAWFALRHVDLSLLKSAAPWQVTAILTAVVANILVTATLFWVVTKSFDTHPPVTWTQMRALVAASGLLNYLGIQAGSISRAAYLKARNNLPVMQSVAIQLVVVSVSTVVSGVVALTLVGLSGHFSQGFALTATIVGVVGCALVTSPIAKGMLRRPLVSAWSWAPLKALDLALTALRVWVSFQIVGREISPSAALAMAGGIAVVNLLSVTPNGLGLREWAVAVMASVIDPSLWAVAMVATLVDRALEAIVLIVTGLASVVVLRRP